MTGGGGDSGGLKGRRTIAQGNALGSDGVKKIPHPANHPPDLLRAGRGVICRMRGMGRASHPQGVAPPLASLYPGLG